MTSWEPTQPPITILALNGKPALSYAHYEGKKRRFHAHIKQGLPFSSSPGWQTSFGDLVLSGTVAALGHCAAYRQEGTRFLKTTLFPSSSGRCTNRGLGRSVREFPERSVCRPLHRLPVQGR